MFEEAQRILKLPTYVFARLDKLKAEARAKGVDLIDLGIGSPDVPPPPEVVEALIQSLKDPANHRYSSFEGLPEFNHAVTNWCHKQYDIHIDPEKEVAHLIGSKEGLVHLVFAYVNPGDATLAPSPAYPAHFRGTILAGGTPYVLPTTERTGFIPDLKAVDEGIARRAKMLILNYPTNPTAATVAKEFFEEAVGFAKHFNLILVHDFAYAEVYFENQKPVSVLSIRGAKEICIEFHTLSKTFGMAGWRVGFAVGNSELIETLRKIKTNLDYGLFLAVQRAAIVALSTTSSAYLENMRMTYQRRRDIFVKGLEKLGWKVNKPMATMYLWIPVPRGYTSTDWSLHLLEKTGVVAAPGIAFGDLGEGYARIALVEPEKRLEEALSRMEKAGIRYSNH